MSSDGGSVGLGSSGASVLMGRRKCLFNRRVLPESRQTSYDRPFGLMSVIFPLLSHDLDRGFCTRTLWLMGSSVIFLISSIDIDIDIV